MNSFEKPLVLQKNISDGKNTISMLEQLICIKEDVNNQLEFSKDKVNCP